MIVTRPMGIETRFQVSEAVAARDLCIQHGTKLTPTGKPANAMVSPKRADLFVEKRPRQNGCQLSEDCVTVCHGLHLLFWGIGLLFSPYYTVVYRSASLFSSFFRRETYKREIQVSKNMSPRSNWQNRKNALLLPCCATPLSYTLYNETESLLIHSP